MMCRWPEAAFFGGPIEPCFEGRPPRWLEQSWRKFPFVFAVRELGDSPFEISQRADLPFGANFAICASVQKGAKYDPRLGVRPNSEIRGEETSLLEGLLDAGARGRWVPQARVRHFIPKVRQRIAYLRSFYFGTGQTMALTEKQEACATLFGRPRWLYRAAIESEFRYRVSRLISPSEVWLKHLAAASTSWGLLVGSRGREPNWVQLIERSASQQNT
jgi:glucosyl-dolichyl phosphate glucuronosyltransferase